MAPPNIEIDPAVLATAADRTVVITGAAGGIGAATAALANENGANVVIADLPSARAAAEKLIATLAHPDKAIFVPADILHWGDMTNLFKKAVAHFGRVDVVVANAGIMETKPVLDLEAVDDNGDLLESREAFGVIDVNIKGTLNTIRLGLHTMRHNEAGGSILLVASTSGYFGGTGVAAYITSKHGVIGLLRSCQAAAKQNGVRLNAVAPFFTPTHITANFADAWAAAGLEGNTADDVARVVLQQALNPAMSGSCVLACGSMRRELEGPRAAFVEQWMGSDVTKLMGEAGKLFAKLGGYPLPKARQ
ncbi:hypothetical protein SEPCBS119000_006218 [Sporothrix epigloea]|uniref:Short chain dehydrogenase/reductase n=1 Tax=Sporothrix epigloea TaxID=1892477 RepID=A0ABP0E510_9PEZI